jgi:hypothetical protein
MKTKNKNQECKRHNWKIGAYKGGIKGKKIIKLGLWVFCTKCNKRIYAKL